MNICARDTHLLGLALGAFPTSLNRSARDFASTLSRKNFGTGGATLDPSEPPERYCVHVFGTQARSQHRDPLGRRSTRQDGPISSVSVGSTTSNSESQTRHRRRTRLSVEVGSLIST